jgi:hypothetical protein
MRHSGIAGSENAIATETDSELLLERVPDVNPGNDAEVCLPQYFHRALNRLVEIVG